MPDWGAALKVVIGGHMVTAQSWSCGFWVGLNLSGSGLTQTQVDAILAAINTQVATWWTGIKSFNATDVGWDNLTVNFYPSGSRTASIISRSSFTPVMGSVSGNNPLPQAMVCSLRSTSPGRSGRGRMYVPFTGPSVGSGHQYTLSQVTPVASTTQVLLTAINNLNLTTNGVTSQQVVINSVTKGTKASVTKVVCDSLPDFQDRRQDKVAALNIFSATL